MLLKITKEYNQRARIISFVLRRIENTTIHSGTKFKAENWLSPTKISLLNNGVCFQICQNATNVTNK